MIESAPQLSVLLLASASPRRKQLLQEMGLRFDVCPVHVEELEIATTPPAELVLTNSARKAHALAADRPDALILGADTTVAIDDKVLNKPADMLHARSMLKRLSGRTHEVYTGISLVCRSAGVDEHHFVTSKVTFKELSEGKIAEYFNRVNPFDKAGAYGIQESGDLIIAKLEGSLNNVIGLPTEFLRTLLEKGGLWSGLQAKKSQ